MNRKRILAPALGLAAVARLHAFQAAFREYPGQEYTDFPLPPDYREKAEFVFARLMYPQGNWGIFGGLWRFDWRQGHSAWTNDYPRSDRHFAAAQRRLTRVHVRSVEQPVNLDDGDDVFNWPWLYSVGPNQWNLTEAQTRKLREYLGRGGFLLGDDFWGSQDWAYFERNISRQLPGRPIVEIENDDAIFHTVFDLDERYQVSGAWSLRGRPYLNDGIVPHWRAGMTTRAAS